jgi:CRISPR-associated protein Cmr3
MRQLALAPRDGLFCKDGRGWFTSSSGRGHGLDWPWPSTVLGALRTAWGRQREQQLARPLNAAEWREHTALELRQMLALRRPLAGGTPVWSAVHRVWPCPRDAFALEERGLPLHALQPQPLPLPTLGRGDDAAQEALWYPSPPGAGKPQPLAPWWRDEPFVAWLCGEPVRLGAGDGLQPTRRVEAHVGLGERGTAEEGLLFAHDVRETLEADGEWALGVEVAAPATWGPPSLVPLGGDRRLTRAEPLPSAVFAPAQRLLAAFDRGSVGLRLVVVTPALFTQGWVPDGLERQGREFRGRLPGVRAEVILRAALVPRPVPLSGWDLAENRPKRAARAVPPGSVYFLVRADGRPFGPEEAQALWLAGLGERGAEGFGRVVPGVWTPGKGER